VPVGPGDRSAADPTDVTTAYLASPGFAADMDGFDVGDIVTVEDLLLDPAAASPLSAWEVHVQIPILLNVRTHLFTAGTQ